MFSVLKLYYTTSTPKYRVLLNRQSSKIFTRVDVDKVIFFKKQDYERII